MRIPYFREVATDPDAGPEFECLACRSRFVGRRTAWPTGRPLAHCPYCGIRWAGERVWDRARQALKAEAANRRSRWRPPDYEVQTRFAFADGRRSNWVKAEWVYRYDDEPVARLLARLLANWRAFATNPDGHLTRYAEEYRIVALHHVGSAATVEVVGPKKVPPPARPQGA